MASAKTRIHRSSAVAALGISLLSLLLVNKKIPATSAEMDFIHSIGSYRSRTFYFYRNLPLPGLIYHAIHSLSTHLYPFSLVFGNIRIINFALLVLALLGTSSLSQTAFQGPLSWIAVLTYILGLSADSSIILLTNDLLAILFLVAGLMQLRRSSWATGLFLGLSVSCSWTSLCIYPPLIILHLVSQFRFLVNPANHVHRAFLKTFRLALAFVLAPLSIYLVSFWLHYRIQECLGASDFSIEFQATLKNSTLDAADRYLMDRSIVTILNQKHNTYLAMENDHPFGSPAKSEASMWTIVKVHVDETGNAKIAEEHRYVNHGDLVKIIGFSSSRCLKVAKDDSEDKFKAVVGSAQTHDSAEEDEIWQVIGDGSVVARQSLIRFRHYKTGADLCMRDLQRIGDDSEADDAAEESSTKTVNASMYSEHRSRLFYISDNRNHDFFKKNFPDGRPRRLVLKFPKKSFIQKLLEHSSRIRRGLREPWSPLRSHTLVQLPGGHHRMERNMLLAFASALSSVLLPPLIILNHVSHRKYGRSIHISQDTVFACILHLSACVTELFLSTRPMLSEVLGVWNILQTLQLVSTKTLLAFFFALLSSSARINSWI